MRQRHDRQVLADHRGHLAAAIAGRIDDVLALDAPAVVSMRQPPCWQLRIARHPGVPIDRRAAITRALGQGLRQLRGVDIAVVGIPKPNADAVELEERVTRLDFRGDSSSNSMPWARACATT